MIDIICTNFSDSVYRCRHVCLHVCFRYQNVVCCQITLKHIVLRATAILLDAVIAAATAISYPMEIMVSE